MRKISYYMDTDIILLDDDICYDRYDLAGTFVCIQNPPGFDFKPGLHYVVSGMGSLHMNAEWDDKIDLEEHVHGYCLSNNSWDLKKGKSVKFRELIPTEIFIRYFVHQFRFATSDEAYDFIKSVERDRTIDDILK